jgi:uncharacterized membrane protein
MFFTLDRIRDAVGDQLWLRPAIAGVLAVCLALAGMGVNTVPDPLVGFVLTKEALANLFSIFASSMLAVATFSVSAMVTAVSLVSNSATPRATRLVLEDTTAQNVLAAFISAFIYAIIGLLALEIFEYGEAGRLFLFSGLSLIVAWVLVSFVRWVDHVTKLGRVGNTIDALVDVTLAGISETSAGSFGAGVFVDEPPRGSRTVSSAQTGFVGSLNVAGLNRLAEQHDCNFHVTVRPGQFVHPGLALVHIEPGGEKFEIDEGAVSDCFVIGRERTYLNDFEFGFISLAETADRALSPGINDPGTAIVVLSAQIRLLQAFHEERTKQERRSEGELTYARVFLRPVVEAELLDACFTPIARDGAGLIEVVEKLQTALEVVAGFGDTGFMRAALELSETVTELAEVSLVAEAHKARARQAGARVARAALRGGANSEARSAAGSMGEG